MIKKNIYILAITLDGVGRVAGKDKFWGIALVQQTMGHETS